MVLKTWILLAHEDAMVGSLVHGNEPSGLIIGQEFFNRVISDCQLLNDSTPCS
jgi:hypothetical protein